MKRLTVLYDAACGFCVTCRWWLAEQPSYLDLEFLPAGSPEAARRFPGLAEAFPDAELTVIDDEGGVYRSPESFIMCLYALEEYRELSLRVSSPLLMPLARKVFELVAASRGWLSRLLRLKSEEELLDAVGREVGRPPASSVSAGAMLRRP